MKVYKKITGSQKGQSLVELALVFPIFLIIIAGVVEVSNLLITKNRVESAARAAARFAAAGGSESEVVALNSVTQTLDLSSGLWDIWVFKATVNQDGDDFDVWEIEKVYGLSETVAFTDVNSLIAGCTQNCLQDKVLDQLQTDGQGVHQDPDANPNVNRIAADLQVVGVYVVHDVESILGLDALPMIAEWNSVSAFSTMRVTNPFEVNASNGCSAFPVAVHEGVRSVASQFYPAAGDFDYPDDPPAYGDFYRNVPDVPLVDGQEGYLYYVQDGSGTGNFGWLVWNDGINPSAQTLADSLSWPGNSTNYGETNGGQPATPLYPHVVAGYVNPHDNLDLSMQVGDWVHGSTGSVNSNDVRDALEEHIDLTGRQLRLVVWDDSEGTGQNVNYRIKGFIIAKLVGYKLDQSQGDSWILVEFIRWDNSCGQTSE